MTESTLAAYLAEISSSVSLNELPLKVRELAGQCLLDLLGVAVVGAHSRSSEIARKVALGSAPDNGWCSVIGTDQKTSALSAAFLNGTAAHSLELDDGHRYATGLHNGATAGVAALAACEESNLTLGNLLEGVVAGYEVAGRVGKAINPAHRRKGFHSTGTVGVLGAAAAVARVRGLSAQVTADAIGIAASMGGGIFEFLHSPNTGVKHLHAGNAARSGLLATSLAEGGFRAPLSSLDGHEGFLRVYGGIDPESLALASPTAEQGYDIDNTYFKLHAACGHAFPAIDAALELRGCVPSAAAIREVAVHTYSIAADLDNASPCTTAEAKFSLPYCTAAAFLLGHAGPSAFSERTRQSGEIADLAKRVTLAVDPELDAAYPTLRPAKIAVRTYDGEIYEAHVSVPRGMPDMPISRGDIEAKFCKLVDCDGEDLVAAISRGPVDTPVRTLTSQLRNARPMSRTT